jgi:hypothetical protein
MMDYQSVVHWCNAVSPSTPAAFPAAVIDHVNVLQFATKQDVWFTPDYDSDGLVIDNDRLEQFRLACLYDCLSNMLDIGENLDDDDRPSSEWYTRLVTNDHDDMNRPSWLTDGDPHSIVMRTYRPKGI